MVLNKSHPASIVILLRAIYSLFMPPLCIGCEEEIKTDERWLCRRCLLEILHSSHASKRFLKVAGRDVPVRYALDYTPLVSRLITTFKYHDRPGLSELLARVMLVKLRGFLIGDLFLVSVPMCAAKRRERGYNQSHLLCEAISRLTGLCQLPRVLVKPGMTPSQASLSRRDRIGNLKGKITTEQNHLIKGKRIVIIDDVVTTGATLRECARALLEGGAERVSGCVVASSL